MTTGSSARWAYAVSALVGAAAWGYVAMAGGRREAWDSELYFVAALPLIGLSAGVLGFLVPERAWRWAFVPFGAQAVVAFLQNPTASLLPLGLIVFALLALPCLIPAYVGAKLRTILRPGTA